jgi:hypothetical protein
MDYLKILTIMQKGLELIPALVSAGATVVPLIKRMAEVAKGGVEGTVTLEELEALEADLDAALDEFNAPRPSGV